MKFLLALFTLISFSTFAQDAKSQAILDKLSKKMKDQSSFYIEFSVNIKNSATGTDQNETGKGWVEGDKFYGSFGDNTMISNGTKTWIVIKEEKTVYVTDADDEDDEMINPKKLMSLWESGFKNKYGKETTIGSEAVDLIYLYPKSPGSVDYHTIKLYVSKSSGELRKVVLRMKDGTDMTYKLTKFTTNPTIDSSKFVYDSRKYPGYTEIDG